MIFPESQDASAFFIMKAENRQKDPKDMLQILARTFTTATRIDNRTGWGAPSHWPQGERFDTRERAEIEAHLVGRRY